MLMSLVMMYLDPNRGLAVDLLVHVPTCLAVSSNGNMQMLQQQPMTTRAPQQHRRVGAGSRSPRERRRTSGREQRELAIIERGHNFVLEYREARTRTARRKDPVKDGLLACRGTTDSRIRAR